MAIFFAEDQHFQGISYVEVALTKGEYENCTFSNCIFANSSLSFINFINCDFINCDFSLAYVKNTAFNDSKIKDCKLVGVKFEECSTFGFAINFEKCQLNLSSFYKLGLKNTKFKDCNLEEVDFGEANLGGVVFNNCNLLGAKFDHTFLEKVDFRSAYNFSIDPEKNKIKKAKFLSTSLAGLLEKYTIEIE